MIDPVGKTEADTGSLWYLAVAALAVTVASLVFYVIKVVFCKKKEEKEVFMPALLEQEVDVPEA